MIRNTIFVILTGKNVIKIITFLINLEDNHPNSEVRLIAPFQIIETLDEWLKLIKFNLNIKIENLNNKKDNLDIFFRNNYELYILDKLVKNNNVIIMDNPPFMQMALPLHRFNKDFGGLEYEDRQYSPELVYFTNASLANEVINKARETFNEICLPNFKNLSARIIQQKWFWYKKKINKNIVDSEFNDLYSSIKKFAGLKYKIEENNKYTLDKLDYDISLRGESLFYKNKINEDLIKKEEGMITYKGKVCSLLSIPIDGEGFNPQCYAFINKYITLIMESRNNIRNYFSLWSKRPIEIKKCLYSFGPYSPKDVYINNFLHTLNTIPIFKVKNDFSSFIQLGVDNVYIYDHPTSSQFNPSLLASFLLILAYPMKAEDINILDKFKVPYYNLNMNLPQSITKIIEVQKLKLKKENEIYSLGCHKLLIFNNTDNEKKEYTEYLKKVSSSRYMIVYNDYKYNKCTQITEALAFGTIPILLKENNIIINNKNFKEGIHYILTDSESIENKVGSISDEEYNRLKQNCLDFYNKYESEYVFSKKLMFFMLSKYENFRKFSNVKNLEIE